MKRLFSLLLASVLAVCCTGCGGTAPVPARAAEYGYFCYPGVDWAVSEEAFLETMGKSAGDFTVKAEKEGFGKAMTYQVETVLLGREAALSAQFVSVSFDEVPLLRKITVAPKEKLTEAEYRELCKELEKLVHAQGVEVNEPEEERFSSGEEGEEKPLYLQWSLSSVRTNRDLPRELLDDYNSYYRYCLEADEFSGWREKYAEVDYDYILMYPPGSLSTLTALFQMESGSLEETGRVWIIFNGAQIWNALGYQEALSRIGR